MTHIKHIETWGNGLRIFAVEEGARAVLSHGSVLVKGNQTFQVGTCTGYCALSDGKGFGALANGQQICRDGIDDPVWIIQRPSTIARGAHRDANSCALQVAAGQEIWLESKVYKIVNSPNQNLRLKEVVEG